MGTPAPADKPRLSDEDLFDLLPASEQEKYRPRVTDEEKATFRKAKEKFIRDQVKEILDELWNRHYPAQVQILHVKLCRICPPEEPDRDGFAAECTKKAYTAFLRRTFKQSYENFAGYLYTIFVSTAIDEYRRIHGRKPEGAQDGEPARPGPPPPVTIDEVPNVVSAGKGPLQELTEEQLRGIIEAILHDHAREHPISARTVRLRGTEGKTWPEIAETVFPADKFEKSLEARNGDVRRLFKQNRAEIVPKLEKYGITSEHTFHWKEAYSGARGKSRPE